MSQSTFPYYAYVLRTIADNTGIKPLSKLALEPGIQSAYRITVHYYDKRACDSVGTLCRLMSEDERSLEMRYQGAFQQKPLFYPIELERYEAFLRTMQKAQLDRLPDQPNLPMRGVDLWLVERAAGGFSKSVILAPKAAEGAYETIVNSVKIHLPEAVREIR
jgi:hypothetical protein